MWWSGVCGGETRKVVKCLWWSNVCGEWTCFFGSSVNYIVLLRNKDKNYELSAKHICSLCLVLLFYIMYNEFRSQFLINHSL